MALFFAQRRDKPEQIKVEYSQLNQSKTSEKTVIALPELCGHCFCV